MSSPLATLEAAPRPGPVGRGQQVLLAPTSPELPVLVSAPIPSGWILEGQPEARAIELIPAGKGQCSSGVWACSAGRFVWHFASDEIVRILNGEVTLRFGTHVQIARAGDVVAFRGGSVVEWTVPEYVEKFWVLGPAPTFTARVRRSVRRLARR